MTATERFGIKLHNAVLQNNDGIELSLNSSGSLRGLERRVWCDNELSYMCGVLDVMLSGWTTFEKEEWNAHSRDWTKYA